jgi:HSP20 family protein
MLSMLRELIPWTRSAGRLAAGSQPEDLFAQLHREMNQLFDEAWHGFNLPAFADVATGGQALRPRIDIAETDKEVEVTVELPGLDEKDVDVTLADGVLTIKGEKKSERKEDGKGYQLSERSFGSFQRAVALPDGVDADKVTAEFTKGVLKVTAPKRPELHASAKKISIKAG